MLEYSGCVMKFKICSTYNAMRFMIHNYDMQEKEKKEKFNIYTSLTILVFWNEK